MNVDLATGDKRPHPLVGTVVEPYAILDVIAAGGMGVVFKARHMLTDRIVAMKLLPSELARDESNVQRVKLEAKALAQLNHPNIVTTFDFGFTYMQEPFIVMEYVAGQSLKEVLDREVLLPVDRAIKIFLQAVDGMRYAHSAKILHRDLKPHNIMVSEEPEPDHVKILDFGVAKFAEYTQQITRTGEVVGSPLYMSPEQCTGRPTDHRCDIYSIGVMMFETLTGNPPFRGENYISTVHLKCTKLAPNFRDVVPGRVFPDRLETIVLKCLEIEPDKRYATMAELRADLELVAGVVPKVERSKTSQNLGIQSSSNTAKASENQPKMTSPGPGEIGWKPAWAGNNTPNMVSRAAADDWSDSLVTSTEPNAWQPANGGQSFSSPVNSPPNFANQGINPHSNVDLPLAKPAPNASPPPNARPSTQPAPGPSYANQPAQPAANPARSVDLWRDHSSPSVADDSWRGPSSPNLSADDWNNLEAHNMPTGLTGQWPQAPAPPHASPVEPPPVVAQTPTTTNSPHRQDMASLSAALEASSVSGPSISAMAAQPPAQTQPTSIQSQVITGDHPTIQVGSTTVPVPTPNKEPGDSHFVLTWDSKSGPAWSATTAAPQKPRGPFSPNATNTRNPIQTQSADLSRNAPNPAVGGQPAQQQAIAQGSTSPANAVQNSQPVPSPQAQNMQGSQSAPGSEQPTAEPAWAQAPPSGLQPSPWDSTAPGVINPASAYGWRPASPEPEAGQIADGSASREEAGGTQQQQQQQSSAAPSQHPAQGGAPPPRPPSTGSATTANPNIATLQGQQGFPNPASAQGFTLPNQHGQAFAPSAGVSTGQHMASASPQHDNDGQYHPAASNLAMQSNAIPPHLQALPADKPLQQAPNSQGFAPPNNQQPGAGHQVPERLHSNAPPPTENSPPNQADRSRTVGGGDADPWAELSPTHNPHTGISNPPQRADSSPTGPPPNAVASSSGQPHFNSPPSPWGPQPVQLDFLTEEKTVAVAKPTSPPQNLLSASPDRTGTGSVVNNPMQPPPFGDNSSSPIQQLAQRMADSISSMDDSVEHHYPEDNGTEFKNYEPVSLAELNAIKTPIAKAQKPVADSGLSNMLPVTPTPAPLPAQKRNRFAEGEDDTESGARSHAASLRFNTSRGGNDGKKVVLMSLSGVAILIVIAIIGFKVYKYYEAAPQQASTKGAPVNVIQTPDKPLQTTSDSSPTPRSAQGSNATTADTTTPAVEKPTKSAQRSPTSTSKKKPTVAVKPRKLKKPKAVAKAPAPSPDVPATVKHRRAYSTYDSYYKN